MHRNISIKAAKKRLIFNQPVYGEIGNTRFRIVRIGTKYITAIGGQVLSIDGVKLYA